MEAFRYKAFGLMIESELEIPEFIAGDGTPDVYIHYGLVADQLVQPVYTGVRFQASPNQFILKVDHIAKYFVENGETITVEAFPGCSTDEVRLFLLGSVFGALIHQRGLLPVHGSSLVFENKAVIFSGISGAGKSTLAAGFIQKGYKLLSDDISVVSLDENKQAIVAPGYPNMKLWADALEKLGLDPLRLTKVRPLLNKHNLAVHSNFITDTVLLSGVYILNTRNAEGLLIEPLKGIEKFNALKNNTYRLNFINGLKNNESHFGLLSVLSGQCFVKRISRPSRGFSLDQLIETIEKEILHGS